MKYIRNILEISKNKKKKNNNKNMGNNGSVARNILNSAIDQSINILNESITECEVPITQSQLINVFGCTEINISNINFRQNGEINIACAQEASSESSVETQINQVFTQSAEAINQVLNLTGSSTAENITSLMQSLSTDIQNAYSVACIAPVVQEQTVNSQCSTQTGGTANISQINFEQTASALVDCVQNIINRNQTKTQIENIIDQQSRAVIEPLITFGGILLIVIVIIAILLFFVGGSIKTIIIVVLIIAVLFGGYLIVAWFSGWWPFIPQDNITG